MRRAAILIILAFLFLTVTGITVARERTSDPEKGDRQGVSVEDTTKKSSAKSDKQKGPAEKSEATATKKNTKISDKGLAEKNETTAQPRAQNSDKPKPDKTKAAEGNAAKRKAENVGKAKEASETEDIDTPPDKSRPTSAGKSSGNGKPEGVGKAADAAGRPDSAGKPASKPAGGGKTEDAGKAKGKGWGGKGKGKAQGRGDVEDRGGQGKKATVCHAPPGNPDNKHTITVGASAVQAHLGHGDREGSCPGQ